MVHGLSCSAACGIFLDQGSEPVSLALAGGFLTTELPGKSQAFYYFLKNSKKSGHAQSRNASFLPKKELNYFTIQQSSRILKKIKE